MPPKSASPKAATATRTSQRTRPPAPEPLVAEQSVPNQKESDEDDIISPKTSAKKKRAALKKAEAATFKAPKPKTEQTGKSMQPAAGEAAKPPATKQQGKSSKAEASTGKPAPRKPTMNLILPGYAEAVKKHRAEKAAALKILAEKRAAEEEAARFLVNFSPEPARAKGKEVEFETAPNDDSGKGVKAEKTEKAGDPKEDKGKNDRKGKGKAVSEVEESLTKAREKRPKEVVGTKVSEGEAQDDNPPKKAKEGPRSTRRSNNIRGISQGVTSYGVGSTRGGNSASRGSRGGASGSGGPSGGGGGGKKRKADDNEGTVGEKGEEEEAKEKPEKKEQKTKRRKSKKAKNGAAPDGQPSSSDSSEDSDMSRASGSEDQGENDDEGDEGKEGEDGEDGEDDEDGEDAEEGEDKDKEEDKDQIGAAEARDLRRRIAHSSHPQIAYDAGLTKELVEDLSHNKGQHIKLSLKDTPEWVARHIFGDRYEEETDINLIENLFQKLSPGARPNDFLNERLIWEIMKNMLQTALQLQPNQRRSKYKNNNKTRQVANIIWQLMTFGTYYDTEKEEHHDPNNKKYDQLCPHYSEILVRTVSDEARDDLKNDKGQPMKPKTPEALIKEAIDQIAILDSKVKDKKRSKGGNEDGFTEKGGHKTVREATSAMETIDEGIEDETIQPSPGQAMKSLAPSDASFEAMNESDQERELVLAEELRDRIARTPHPELDPLDSLTKEQIEGLSKNQGKNLPKLSLKDTKEWVAKHLIGAYDDRYNWVNFRRLLSGSQSLDEKVIWEIFRNMARTAHKLQDNARNNEYKDTNKAKQVASLAWQLMTNGRFYDHKKDVLHDPLNERHDVLESGGGFSKNIVDYLTMLMTLEIKKSRNNTSCIPKNMISRATEEIEKLGLEAMPKAEVKLKLKAEDDEHYMAESDSDEDEQESIVTDYSAIRRALRPPSSVDSAETTEVVIEIDSDLPENYKEVYDGLVNVVQKRCVRNNLGQPELQIPRVVVICDTPKSIETILSLIVLAELHRLKIIKLQAVIATLMPADCRAEMTLGILELLNLPDVPVGIGSTATTARYDLQAFEFDGTDSIVATKTEKLKNGSRLLYDVLCENELLLQKSRLVLLTSLTDIAYLSVEFPNLLTSDRIEFVSMQGKYKTGSDGGRDPDLETRNNLYDKQAAEIWYQYMNKSKIPSIVWTEDAATGMNFESEFWQLIESPGLNHPLGLYLNWRRVTYREVMTNLANTLAVLGSAGHDFLNELCLLEGSDVRSGIGMIISKDAVAAAYNVPEQLDYKKIEAGNMTLVIQALVLGNLWATKTQNHHPDDCLPVSLGDETQEETMTSGNTRKRTSSGNAGPNSSPQSKKARTSPQTTRGGRPQPSKEAKSAQRRSEDGLQNSSGRNTRRNANRDTYEQWQTEDDDLEQATFLSLFGGRDPDFEVDVAWSDQKVTLREVYAYFMSLEGTDQQMSPEEICSALGSIGT